MLTHRSMLTACAAVMLGAVLAVSVEALERPARTTYLTFNTPFALPGIALPPGTYIFERAESSATLNLVRVLSRDRSHVYLTAFTHLIERPAGLRRDRQVSFAEVRSGFTRPITAWYPIGESVGHQFLYEKEGRQLSGRDGN